MTIEWTDIPRAEEYQSSLTWIPVDRALPEAENWVWIQTKSGKVAMGYVQGPWWTTNGFRILDASDSVIRWAEIEYPEGPVYIP